MCTCVWRSKFCSILDLFSSSQMQLLYFGTWNIIKNLRLFICKIFPPRCRLNKCISPFFFKSPMSSAVHFCFFAVYLYAQFVCVRWDRNELEPKKINQRFGTVLLCCWPVFIFFFSFESSFISLSFNNKKSILYDFDFTDEFFPCCPPPTFYT